MGFLIIAAIAFAVAVIAGFLVPAGRRRIAQLGIIIAVGYWLAVAILPGHDREWGKPVLLIVALMLLTALVTVWIAGAYVGAGLRRSRD